jgi:hypothetical protein
LRDVADHAVENHPREETKRHPVPAVAQRKQVARVSTVRPDVGQTIGRRGEQPLPCVLGAQVTRGGIEIDEIRA